MWGSAKGSDKLCNIPLKILEHALDVGAQKLMRGYRKDSKDSRYSEA